MADILLIDDERSIRTLFASVLADEGLTVAVAADGREGIELFREEPARLVVSDLYMPEMDGLDVVRELRREWPGVRILLMSGGGKYGNTDLLEVGKHLGAIATIEKPFTPDELVTAVRAALDD